MKTSPSNAVPRTARWCVLLTAACFVATGCKTIDLASLGQRDKPVEATSQPGAGSFTSNTKLKNPEKVHLAYARWQERIQQPNEARASYQKVLEHNPKSLDALLGLSRIDQLNGRMAAAEEHLVRAEAAFPGDARVLAAYGQWYAAQQKWPEAIDQLRRATDASGGNAVYRFELGIVLMRSGDSQSAYQELEKAVGAAEAHYNIAFIYNEKGQTGLAEQHLQKALSIKADLLPAKALLASLKEGRPNTAVVRQGQVNTVRQASGVREQR
ncbi:MAG: tetratricopeptide repeat protein [Planctomycetaceae bacterium]|nr:tetratricopeptide repeat protein [Planctomycetaceae bacterium]